MSLTVADARRERLKAMPSAGRGEAAVPRRVAFWLLALVFATTQPPACYEALGLELLGLRRITSHERITS